MIKNLRVRLAAYAAVIGIGVLGGNPEVVKADEAQVGDVLFEVTTDNVTKLEFEDYKEPVKETPIEEVTEKREFGENEYIDSSNWRPEIDIAPNPGIYIPDTVRTEGQRKDADVPSNNKTPEVVTPTITTPEPQPETKPETKPEKKPEKKKKKDKKKKDEEIPKEIPKTGDNSGKVLGGAVTLLIMALYEMKKHLKLDEITKSLKR